MEKTKNEMNELDYFIKELNSFKRYSISKPINSGKKIVISDCDECLVNITIKWVELGKLMNIFPDNISIEDIINRKDYDISSLMNPFEDNIKIFNKFKVNSNRDISMEIYKLKNFYDDLMPTEFGNGIKELSKNGLIDLKIISHTIEENKESKERFLKKNFPNATIHLIPPNKYKSEIINEFDYNEYSTFIDDDLRNIYDILINTKSFGKEFIMPKFGYNDAFYDADLTEEEIRNKKFTDDEIAAIETIEDIGSKLLYVDPI